MLSWAAALGLGAVGGLIIEVVALWKRLTAWQADRRRLGDEGRSLTFREYWSWGPDGSVAVTRMVLGALAGVVCHGQVTGVPAAIAVGASAPSLLSQLGGARRLDIPGLPTVGEPAGASEPG